MKNECRSDEENEKKLAGGIQDYERYLWERERHPNTVRKYLHDIGCFLRFVQESMGSGAGGRGELCAGGRESHEDSRELCGGSRESHEDSWELCGGSREPHVDSRELCAGGGEQPEIGREGVVCGKEGLRREWVICYKEYLVKKYQVSSVNSMLTALNGYLKFIGREDCCVQLCRVQRRMFREEEKDLSQEEYRRLVQQAGQEGNLRLGCILQTMGSTGIRVGELKYITVESLERMVVWIRSKGKERCIVLPKALVVLLRRYCRQKGIGTGSIFITRSGRLVDRRNVWTEIKKLCRVSGIPEGKGFPHNLRHLFARMYYEKEKDIVRLADHLGHSNVETTRRYTMVSSMRACMMELELGMLVEGYLDRSTEEVTRRRKKGRCRISGGGKGGRGNGSKKAGKKQK